MNELDRARSLSKSSVSCWTLLLAIAGCHAAHAADAEPPSRDLTFKQASCGVSPNLPFYLQFPKDFEATDLGLGGCLWGTEDDRALVKGKGQRARLKEKRLQRGVFWYRVIRPGAPLSWMDEQAQFYLEDSLDTVIGGPRIRSVEGTREDRAGYPTLQAIYTTGRGEHGYMLFVGDLGAGYAVSIEYVPAPGDAQERQEWDRFLDSISDRPPGFLELPSSPENVLESALRHYRRDHYSISFALDSRVPAKRPKPIGRVLQRITLEYKGGAFTRLHNKITTEREEWTAFFPNGRPVDFGGMWSQPNGDYTLAFEGGEFRESGPGAPTVRTVLEQAEFEEEHLSWLSGILGVPYMSSLAAHELLESVTGLYDFRLLDETTEEIRLSGAVKSRGQITVPNEAEGIPELIERFRRRLPQVELLLAKDPLRVVELAFSGHTAKAPLSVSLEVTEFDFQ